MNRCWFVTAAVVLSGVVWAISFCELTALIQISHLHENRYFYHLFNLMWQAFVEGDEELITVTCLTLWAAAWGTFLASLVFCRPCYYVLTWPAACAAFVFMAWLLGMGVLRHLFSVEIDHYFHVAYSIVVTVVSLMMLWRAWRGSERTCAAA